MWEKKERLRISTMDAEKKVVNKQKYLMIVLLIVAAVGIGGSGYLYMQYQKVNNLLKTPGVAGQLEAKDLIRQISRLMVLPKDEDPTVATVSDLQKLKDQPFFKNAQNGDKVLIYTKSALAILYSPKMDKIIAVSPVNLGQGATPLRIALYNGTKVAGLTNSVEEQLKSKVNEATISVKQNAKKEYTKTLVVDLTGNQQKAASDLAAFLGGETGSLPDGESAPANTDLLIILGR